MENNTVNGPYSLILNQMGGEGSRIFEITCNNVSLYRFYIEPRITKWYNPIKDRLHVSVNRGAATVEPCPRMMTFIQSPYKFSFKIGADDFLALLEELGFDTENVKAMLSKYGWIKIHKP